MGQADTQAKPRSKSAPGQPRHFDRGLVTSGPPPETDILGAGRHVANAPITEVLVHAETGHAPSHGRASFAMCSARCSASSPKPCKNEDFNLWSQGRPRK